MFIKQQLMHIPDGFLSLILSLILWVISIITIFIAIRHYTKEKNNQKLPLMGVLAAAIFAGQMLNFNVVGGTSGHLLGAALATILVGPWEAVLVMTSVVSVQAIIFQDGGLLALGANIFNMAVIGVAVSYAVYTILNKVIKKGKWAVGIKGFIAGWCSIFIAALAAALELAISGTSPANIAIPAMGSIHALIGIGEGLITFAALLFISTSKKEMLDETSKGKPVDKSVLVGGVIIALVLAILSPLASSNPDGLEKVAEDLGFISLDSGPLYEIIPDYTFPGIHDERLATIVAGVIGVILIATVTFITTNRKKNSTQEK
ncbi:MAG TPA: cobalamin biosynthesis protein CbiM [Anaerolineaceae bacterium]|nr:cobalamin biosynthesis protein CbiM [Anaerolineaceae bacterium]